MLDNAIIDARLREMEQHDDPKLLWDENCGGSARALVVFVGPSPGADPTKPPERCPIRRKYWAANWNKEYENPHAWSRGFQISFPPLVEAIFDERYKYETASKLVARGNLDWANNPNAKEVPEQFMREGAQSVLRMLEGCSPDLVIPMEKIAFRVLKDVMQDSGFAIAECPVKKFYVRLNAVAAARKIRCFRATSPKGHTILVIKLPQHPARIFQATLAARCGRAVRLAALQIAAGQPADVTGI